MSVAADSALELRREELSHRPWLRRGKAVAVCRNHLGSHVYSFDNIERQNFKLELPRPDLLNFV